MADVSQYGHDETTYTAYLLICTHFRNDLAGKMYTSMESQAATLLKDLSHGQRDLQHRLGRDTTG